MNEDQRSEPPTMANTIDASRLTPTCLTFELDGGRYVRVYRDGRVEHPGDIDEAARAFWTALQRVAGWMR